MTKPLIPITGLAHLGIRVHDLARSVQFYELLGFTKTAGPIGPEPVAILDHPVVWKSISCSMRLLQTSRTF